MIATLFPSAGNKQTKLKPYKQRYNSLAASQISTKQTLAEAAVARKYLSLAWNAKE